VRQSASATLPMTGGQPGQSGHLLRLRQQRRTLARLLHVAEDVVRSCRQDEAIPADCFVRCPEWIRLYRQCERHQLQWRCNIWRGGIDARAWLSETRSARNRIRAAIRKEVRRMAHSNLTASAARLKGGDRGGKSPMKGEARKRARRGGMKQGSNRPKRNSGNTK
jgi:hypothetical protein